MPRSKDRKPAKATKDKSPRTDPAPVARTWWEKTRKWVGGVLLVALGAALNDPLQFMFGRVIENFGPRVGDPIQAVATLGPDGSFGYMLPGPHALSEQDLDSLGRVGPNIQGEQLEEKGGIPLGPRRIKLELQSNRHYPVRVTGIDPVSECEEVTRGTLVKTTLRSAGATLSSPVIALRADEPGAEVLDPERKEEPFFPGRTITLTAPEREFVVLLLLPSTTKLCRVHVEITVVDGDREVRQRITPGGKAIPLLPLEEVKEREAEYSSVYLAGGICKRPVLAKTGYLSDVRAACGSGNLGTEPIQDAVSQK